MTSFTTFLYVYLLGGLTFPLLVAYLLFRAAPEARKRTSPAPELLVPDLQRDFKAGDFEEAKGVEIVKKGWVTVTTKYYYHASELVQLAQQQVPIENLPSRVKLKRKHNFYAVLKHGNLFLYRDDSPDAGVAHVIVLKDSFVSLWPRDTRNEALDGSLFTKKMCIAILRNGTASIDQQGNLDIAIHQSDLKHFDQFFVYVTNNTEKEDWYFALINASKVSLPKPGESLQNGKLNPNVSAKTAHFRTRDMLYLIQTLNSNEGQLSTKWLNALLGRLFLGLQQTETLSLFLRERLYKKLTKINKPGFLDDFVIERVDVGNAAPVITHPELRELTPTGLMKIAFQFFYKGGMSLIISTKANINLGSRFKTREVALELAVTVKEIVGPMVVMVKPPPSNRIWYSFETEPLIDLDVEPVVSTKQLSYNMVTNAIKSKFREAIKESLVMPFMDDMTFYNTRDDLFRGGIWEQEQKAAEDSVSVEGDSELFDQDKDGLDTKTEASESHKSSIDSQSDIHSASMEDMTHDSEILNNKKTEDSASISVKQKTLQKVETFKSLLKRSDSTSSSNESDCFEDENPKKSAAEVRPPIDSEDSKISKKYLNAGFKKFGKWYKDTVTSSSSIAESTDSASSHPQNTPEMISNRRTLPKAKEREVLKMPPENIRRSSNAAEMFAKTKPRSGSVNSSAGTSTNARFRLGTSPPHSPSLVNSWAGHHSDDEPLETNTFEAVDSEKFQASDALGKLHTEEQNNEAVAAAPAIDSVEDQPPKNDAALPRVNLHELNKRRPVPPTPVSIEKPTGEKEQPTLPDLSSPSHLLTKPT
ncbi:LAQU0S04e06216g1_1 [Lachancea quebecensis]|uniref:LAQU0S04e06216g1_1 n=1 Tax=Lachancea quebecensis TaxID=1654605 RepID=A0A0P1KQ52_9SACH|nr:LAQU0S04e06216g1_1 [Lachancea quebecensis]